MQQELSLRELNRTKGDNSKERMDGFGTYSKSNLFTGCESVYRESRKSPDSDIQKWIASLTRHELPEGK